MLPFLLCRYIEFNFNEPIQRKIVAYQLTTARVELQSRDPKDFALQVMTWENQTMFVTLDNRIHDFSTSGQAMKFPLVTPFTGIIKTIRLLIRDVWDTQIGEVALAEFQVFEELVNEATTPVERLTPFFWKTTGSMDQCG